MTAKHDRQKGLAKYRWRRDFSKTTEPNGSGAGTAREPHERPSFVVQIHDATALHLCERGTLLWAQACWGRPKRRS
ncbi:hypothetical protein [Streptomyces sp. NPDC056192]|uniref:hypothetical protein n=1 Tax=unclassified Streptomyces TaxID=2593676 RepID=UPI0035DD334E